MSYVNYNLFSSLEYNPNYRRFDFWKNPSYKNMKPVVVSIPNYVRPEISPWLNAEGFQGPTPHVDLTLDTNQKMPIGEQLNFLDVSDPNHWVDKDWTELWKALVTGFEKRERTSADKYFILLITPVVAWTTGSEEGRERHTLFENRNVYGIFTPERGWDGRIVIWMADAVLTPEMKAVLLKPNVGQWEKMENVAQYKGADWKNLVMKMHVNSPDEAQKIAWEDDRIDYFFYTRECMYLEGKEGEWDEKGVFAPGDAVFFSGEPWAGSAPMADIYKKVKG